MSVIASEAKQSGCRWQRGARRSVPGGTRLLRRVVPRNDEIGCHCDRAVRLTKQAPRVSHGLFLAAVLMFSACGYQFAALRTALPEGVRAVSVGTISNHTREFGLEKSLAFAIEREVVRRGALQLVEEPGGGDAVVTGTIRGYTLKPVAFDAADEALQYQLTIAVDLQLRRNDDGRVLWQIEGLRESDEYSAVPRVVVTSSSQFQRGALDPIDLTKFTDIQLAESQKRQAVDRLLETIARDAYALMSEDF